LSWRLRIDHRSTYHYAGEVRSSYNEARITPVTLPGQLVLESAVTVRPHARCFSYCDYWASIVHAFDLHVPHRRLEVMGSSLVETTSSEPDERVSSWADLEGQTCDDLAEYLTPTVMVPIVPEVVAAAGQLRNLAGPAEAVVAAMEWVRQRLAYVAGSTGAHTSAAQALRGGRGVCQDFAHVTLALLRELGIPARYCSGYVHPRPDAEVGSTTAGQSHAWVEYWSGGWTGIDPTVGLPVGHRHVLVARGRDYRDVSPLIGIYHGGRTERLEVEVSLTRLA
jgi:transglutaminase-like putative cysteine protease